MNYLKEISYSDYDCMRFLKFSISNENYNLQIITVTKNFFLLIQLINNKILLIMSAICSILFCDDILKIVGEKK